MFSIGSRVAVHTCNGGGKAACYLGRVVSRADNKCMIRFDCDSGLPLGNSVLLLCRRGMSCLAQPAKVRTIFRGERGMVVSVACLGDPQRATWPVAS